MSSVVKSLKVTCDPVNEWNTFTNGDWVSGQVAVEVEKESQVESLYVKLKGKAEVLWTERYGQTTVVYHSKDKYFSFKHFIILKDKSDLTETQTLLTNQNGETYVSDLVPGFHFYPFTFQIPSQEMPSSFTGSVGKIVYLLEAKLSRSMRLSKTDTLKLNFVSQVDLSGDPQLQIPQHESKDKKMKYFNSGTVAMDVDLEKNGFFQGEAMTVIACIQNNSTRPIKPKYCVYSKHSFLARGKRRLHTKDLVKEVGEPIPPSASEKVTRVITIPHDMEPSILNCSNIKVEYRLRVYLDVKYAFDPEIKIPITILLASQVPTLAPPPAAAGFGFPNVSYANPQPPANAWGVAQPQPPSAPELFDPPPPYGAYAMYPPLTDFGNK